MDYQQTVNGDMRMRTHMPAQGANALSQVLLRAYRFTPHAYMFRRSYVKLSQGWVEMGGSSN